MGNVLTEDASVKCAAALSLPAPHGGTVTTPAAAATPLLRVQGHKVLVAIGLPWTVVAGTCANAPPNQKPCALVTGVNGTTTRLTVNGQPLVLDTSGGLTDGTPPGTIAATDPDLNPKPLLRAV